MEWAWWVCGTVGRSQLAASARVSGSGSGSRSRTVTGWPARASMRAADSPAMLPPITVTEFMPSGAAGGRADTSVPGEKGEWNHPPGALLPS